MALESGFLEISQNRNMKMEVQLMETEETLILIPTTFVIIVS